MPQSLTQLPKTADFKIGGWPIKITDHKIESFDNLFDCMLDIIMDPRSDRQILSEFEKYGVSFEAVIEYCVEELEHDVNMLTNIMWRGDILESVFHPSQMLNTWSKCEDFSKSVAGRKIAEIYIEKIRICDNWGELYDEMHPTSEFIKNINNRIVEELKQCRRV